MTIHSVHVILTIYTNSKLCLPLKIMNCLSFINHNFQMRIFYSYNKGNFYINTKITNYVHHEFSKQKFINRSFNCMIKSQKIPYHFEKNLKTVKQNFARLQNFIKHLSLELERSIQS